ARSVIENDRDGATSGRWDGRELTGQIDSLRTLADTDSALTPIGERPERVEIARAISVEQTFQVFAWVAEDHETPPIDHVCEPVVEGFVELSQVRDRRGGILISLVDIDNLSVVADEALIGENACLYSRRRNHFAGQLYKIGESAGFDCQFNPPGNLLMHQC